MNIPSFVDMILASGLTSIIAFRAVEVLGPMSAARHGGVVHFSLFGYAYIGLATSGVICAIGLIGNRNDLLVIGVWGLLASSAALILTERRKSRGACAPSTCPKIPRQHARHTLPGDGHHGHNCPLLHRCAADRILPSDCEALEHALIVWGRTGDAEALGKATAAFIRRYRTVPIKILEN